MNIYFAASIRGEYESDSRKVFKRIIDILKKYGTVLTEHIGDSKLTSKGEHLPDCEIFKRDIEWLERADLVVAEVTSASLGVGYEIGIAETKQKKVLCLYRGDNLSAMINGNPYLETKFYKDEELEETVETWIREYTRQQLGK